jgi:hypothetical protein
MLTHYFLSRQARISWPMVRVRLIWPSKIQTGLRGQTYILWSIRFKPEPGKSLRYRLCDYLDAFRNLASKHRSIRCSWAQSAPCLKKVPPGSNAYLLAKTPESANAINVNVSVAVIEFENLASHFPIEAIKVPASIRVKVLYLCMEFYIRANQTAEQFQAAAVFLCNSNKVESFDI